MGKISLNFPFRSCKCIQINDYYYISGGFTPGEIETNQCFRIKLEKNEFVVERLPSMIENRANHSLVYIKNIKFLIAIGSFNKINCEYLNLNENKLKWSKIKILLNEIRSNATVFNINDRFVFIIGGCEKKIFKNSYEFFDVNLMNKENFMFKYEIKLNFNLSLNTMGIVLKNNKEFFLFGGFDGKKYKNDKFNVKINEKNEIVSIIKEKNFFDCDEIFFYNQQFEYLNDGKFYNFGFKNKLFIFDSFNEKIIIKNVI